MKCPINYLRLERSLTESWITYHLSQTMQLEELDEWSRTNMPGWDVVSACELNPDDEDLQINDPWPN